MSGWTNRYIALGVLLPLAGLAGSTRAGTVLVSKGGPGGHQYELVSDSAATWSQANADARAKGGFLATIGDAAEQSFVQGLLTDANAQSGSYWFGLRETSTEGDYRNVVSTLPPSYTHWLGDTKQPDNFAGDENSASVLWSKAGASTSARAGFWNDLPNAGGYPQVAAAYPDLTSRGYMVEFFGTGGGFNNGDGDARPSVVPLPAGLWLFPGAALFAVAALWRVRQQTMRV
jgi:hypothetical protein